MVTLLMQRDLLFTPELIRVPEGHRALVLSPHCDDDVIGLGGTMRHHALNREPITVVYFTGGTFAEEGTGGTVTVQRRDEARKAAGILGVTDLIFMGEHEGRLKPSRDLLERLDQIFREVRPEVVYLPWLLDNHVDHNAVNQIFWHSCRRWKGTCRVYAYEVWTPLMPNRIVDITEHAEIKEKALSQYTSRLKDVDYVSTTMALNRYRSITTMKGRGYAEAFLCMDSEEYLDLLSIWNHTRRVPAFSKGISPL
jgi:LmbE family N-acetylglucosaminyl deacetylase